MGRCAFNKLSFLFTSALQNELSEEMKLFDALCGTKGTVQQIKKWKFFELLLFLRRGPQQRNSFILSHQSTKLNWLRRELNSFLLLNGPGLLSSLFLSINHQWNWLDWWKREKDKAAHSSPNQPHQPTNPFNINK